MVDLDKILEVYSLEDLLEFNNITVEEAIERLGLELPEVKPLDFND